MSRTRSGVLGNEASSSISTSDDVGEADRVRTEESGEAETGSGRIFKTSSSEIKKGPDCMGWVNASRVWSSWA